LPGYFTQQLSGLKDRYPDVIAELRGKGLLIGLKLIPQQPRVMALARDERPADRRRRRQCVRLLPSLLITVEEAREAIEKLEPGLRAGAREGRRVSQPAGPRHFLDLWRLDAADLRAILGRRQDAQGGAAGLASGPSRQETRPPPAARWR